MKQELASLELHYLVAEFQSLIDAKLDRIYQPESHELLFQFYLQGKGKYLFRIVSGKFVYLTKHKTESPQKPFGYCIYLRKYLTNARLLSLFQIGFERIIKMVLETKKGVVRKRYHLYVELFGKGNVILCDDNDIILSPLETQVWKDRVVRAREAYTFPKRDKDPRMINEQGLVSMFQVSAQDSLVKALALDLGLGGVYAEEACLLAGLEKTMPPLQARAKAKQLHAMLTSLLHHDLAPCVVKHDDEIVDIVPFPLQRYQQFSCQTFPTYNEALDAVLTEKSMAVKKIEQRQHESTAEHKLRIIIEAQTKQLERMQQEAAACQRNGELIYEHYHMIEGILREIKKAREKYSWKEITSKLKGHNMIKDVNEKDGTIVVDF